MPLIELPNDIESLKKIILSQSEEIQDLHDLVSQLRRKQYGTSSENVSAEQLGMFDEVEVEALNPEPEDDESPEVILQNLKEGFDGYFKQPVTSKNFTTVGTIDQYLVFFRNNWHDFQKVYEGLVSSEELEALLKKKKVQKADLFMLFEKISPKLVSA